MNDTPEHNPGEPEKHDPGRSIDLSVDVVGTPEQVWRAIATGPGISSWYVPHTVEEKAGGAASASFGEGDEMQVAGRVVSWEPPHRVVFDGGEDHPGNMAFEWLIEAKDAHTCSVRLINSGFGDGEEWDSQYDAMHEGWQLFLSNLQLHLAHFGGQSATPAMPMVVWSGSKADSWQRLLVELGVSQSELRLGAPFVSTSNTHAPSGLIRGRVEAVKETYIGLVLTDPMPGTAFLAVENCGPPEGPPLSGISFFCYLYGTGSAEGALEFTESWRTWLTEHSPAPPNQE